jgi:hypothetical protein
MIDPAGRLHPTAAAAVAVSGSVKGQSSPSQLFARTLSDELSKSAASAGETASLSAGSALGQQIVTRQSFSASSEPASSSSTSSGPSLFGLAAGFPSSTGSPGTSAPAAAMAPAPGGAAVDSQSQLSFDNAYWAAQPAAVQQLRNIQDPATREQVAEQLAQEGYTIDVPIMVWGWDPQTTTEARESMGYTWVPSAMQQPVEVAPGVTYNGTTYSSTSPPAGSIPV